MKSVATLTVLICVSIVGCGHSEIGEECDAVGSTNVCVEGAICTNEADGAASCRKVCVTQEDCGATESCNGVSGASIKSCQPDAL
ncbi:MAG: hypothetical protein IPK60_04120 [Sandaracinaceae bacterium]|jgi:hypothetical protein|nr:hypothetical protein [Sandaracinaceae bacterium]